MGLHQSSTVGDATVCKAKCLYHTIAIKPVTVAETVYFVLRRAIPIQGAA